MAFFNLKKKSIWCCILPNAATTTYSLAVSNSYYRHTGIKQVSENWFLSKWSTKFIHLERSTEIVYTTFSRTKFSTITNRTNRKKIELIEQ